MIAKKLVLMNVIVGLKLASCKFSPTWESLDTRSLPTWYDEAKFGIFIHWGVFSVPSFGSEWFWENWKGELAEAIRSTTDLKFGVYHSLYEWFNPLYLRDKEKNYSTQLFAIQKTIPELHELVINYKPAVIWSDGDWEASDTYWTSREFLTWLYNESPVRDFVVVNDRWGREIPCKHGDFFTCHDHYNPGVLQHHKWENCLSVDKQSWGYRRNAKLKDYRTSHELLKELVETVSCGGNLLLNVGPTREGTIPAIMQQRLLEIGSWLNINGEAIYMTRAWTTQNDTLAPNVCGRKLEQLPK